MRQTLFLCIVLLCFSSCDCVQQVSGTVTDKKTGNPVSGVKVFQTNDPSRSMVTGQSGGFSFQRISGGLFGCPPMKLTFECKNYTKRTVSIGNNKIKNIKLKQEAIIDSVPSTHPLFKGPIEER